MLSNTDSSGALDSTGSSSILGIPMSPEIGTLSPPPSDPLVGVRSTPAKSRSRAEADTSELEVGSRIKFEGHGGCVRFIGKTQFAGGTWIGVQLDEPCGRNDGSVAGARYFECQPHCGLFMRPGHEDLVVDEGSERMRSSSREGLLREISRPIGGGPLHERGPWNAPASPSLFAANIVPASTAVPTALAFGGEERAAVQAEEREQGALGLSAEQRRLCSVFCGGLALGVAICRVRARSSR